MTAAADSDRHALTAIAHSDPRETVARPGPAPRSRYRRAETAAHGRFVYVYVDRGTSRPVPLPDRLLAFAKALQ